MRCADFRVFSLLGAGVTPAQGGAEPTVGSAYNIRPLDCAPHAVVSGLIGQRPNNCGLAREGVGLSPAGSYSIRSVAKARSLNLQLVSGD